MDELQPVQLDAHQPGPLGLGQRGRVEPEHAAGAGDRGQVTARGRRHEQHPVRVRSELVAAPREPGRDPHRHRDGGRAGHQIAQPLRLVGERDDGERVAAGRRLHPSEHVERHVRSALPDERGRVVEVEAGHLVHRQAGVDEDGRLPRPHRGQHEDRIGQQPPAGERERLGRGPVEQVRVVDDQPDGTALAAAAQQAQHRGADREPVGDRPLAQRQGDTQGLGLRRRQPVEVVGGHPEQLRQAAERHVLLGLGTGRPEQRHAGRRAERVVGDRGLADARLAAQDEHAAASQPRSGDQAVDDVPLGGPPDQHRKSVGSRD